MAKEWIFILLQLLGVALYATPSPFDQAKKDYETPRADQKLLDGLARAHGPSTNKNKEIGPMNNPQGPEVYIQKSKLNVTHELLNYNNSIVVNGTAHNRKKRSPSYSRNYNVKNTMYSPPTGKSYGKSYQPSSYGHGGPYGPYSGARSGRAVGRYSAEPMSGSPVGYAPVGGGGGGYSAGGYGGGYSAPAMPSYGGGYETAQGGYPGGYAPAPAAGGAAAAAAPQDPYGMIDEKALAKYIDKLTRSSKSRRRRRSSSNESNGSKRGKTRRRRKSKRGEAKANGGSRRRKVSEKAAKKGSRRRKTEKTSRRSSKRRKSSSKSKSKSKNSSSQEYYDDVSAASYDEEPYSKPTDRRARDNDQVKPVDMSEVYTPKSALNYPSQKQSQSDLLLSSLFSSLFQSALTNPVTKPQTTAPPTLTPQQQNVASELAKLGMLIQTTFRKMTSRLDGMKMAREIRLRKETTPGPIDDDKFINSRSTSQWNNVMNRYQRA